MSKIIKNFPVEEVTNLAGQVIIQEGQIVSKTLAQNKHVSITIFAFDKDEEISTHMSQTAMLWSMCLKARESLS